MSVTIGITSHNRGHYLDALLRSLRAEVKRDNHQLIVIDNASDEDAVFDALVDARDIISDHHRRPVQDWINDEYHAKNDIIERAQNDVILFLQDDMQYVGPLGNIGASARALLDSPYLWLAPNPMRRKTLGSVLSRRQNEVNGTRMWEQRDVHLYTTGYFRRDIFSNVGPYPTSWPHDRAYWGRSEDWYDAEAKRRYGSLMRGAHAHVPTFPSVWTDPRGGYAFNREGRRWGHYVSSPDRSGLYYRHLTQDEFDVLNARPEPCSFADVARPLGWTLSLDETGDTLKHSKDAIVAEEKHALNIG